MARIPNRIQIPFVVETTVEKTISGEKFTTTVPVNKAKVVVSRRDGKPATVYQSESGGPIGGELLTNSEGQVPGWVSEGPYNITVSGGTPEIAEKSFAFDAVSGRGAEKVSPSVGEKENNGSIEKVDLVEEVRNSLVPVGAVFPYAGTVAPPGFFLCNGSEEPSAAEYPVLASRLGNTWGTPKAGKIKLPNFTGRMPVGPDPAHEVIVESFPRNVGESGGTSTVTLTSKQLAEHTHPQVSVGGSVSASGSTSGTLAVDNHLHANPGPENVNKFWASTGGAGSSYKAQVIFNESAGDGMLQTNRSGPMDREVFARGSLSVSVTGSLTTTASNTGGINSGSGEAHGNMPPYLAINFIIKHD